MLNLRRHSVSIQKPAGDQWMKGKFESLRFCRPGHNLNRCFPLQNCPIIFAILVMNLRFGNRGLLPDGAGCILKAGTF